MAIIRVEKRNNYTVVDNTFIRDKNLSLKAKGLMLLMLSLPPEWDFSVAGLSAICKEGMTAIRGSLKELEENRYLVRERRNNEKGYFVYEYILTEIPQPYNGNMHAVEEHADDTYADEMHTENRTQINKEELKKEKENKDGVSKEQSKGISESETYDILVEMEDTELSELYLEYIAMRAETDSPLTKRGLQMLIARCERLSNFDTSTQKAMLETSLINGWKNVFQPKEEELMGRNAAVEERKKFYLGS
jgi:hypothetical protein